MSTSLFVRATLKLIKRSCTLQEMFKYCERLGFELCDLLSMLTRLAFCKTAFSKTPNLA